ncbi:MAG: TIGR00159 family protein [Acidobacteria bacterium]|nr:TIGR00159 family protein [Acidobacteriota bacterium]
MDALQTYLSQLPLTWWDVVDLLVVAVVIYEGLKLIRGTRAVQMAIGSLLLVLLYFFSRWAPLQTVNWAIRNIIGYVVFAGIVLFQSDIRRALAHFGRAPVFRYFQRRNAPVDDVIEELVVAATILAEKRLGAIIAIERAIGLRNYIESGIPLDATVTHDLLISIFQTSAPLHDGAVILQEDRLAAAACFLPLTVNPQLSRELGSRHRAAIGLTEENDAIALVVSEETGKISLALEGRIERGLGADLLRARLTELITERRPTNTRGERRREMGGM